MAIRLSDIIDLEYLLAIDEQEAGGPASGETAARDRDIYRQINAPDADDRSLVFSWLEYRKLLYFHEAGPQGSQGLPGRVFSRLYRWMAFLVLMAGVLFGSGLSYSFLAYHGVRPVNVTLFFTLFVLVPALLTLLTLIALLFRRFRPAARTGTGVCHAVMSSLFFKALPRLLKKPGWPAADKGLESLEYSLSLARSRRREYRDLIFWPVFILTSILAVSFSCGALGGTLFRIVTSDVAFGWQSSLAGSSSVVMDLVGFFSFPWSWWAPGCLAGPTPDQIEGSRIILKQGIASLATENLVSWWPFLCFGMLFYGLLPRIALILAANQAGKNALERFDFHRPRFRRLVIRMKSPVMDIHYDEQPVALAARPLPGKPAEVPDEPPDPPSPGPDADRQADVETGTRQAVDTGAGKAVVLASAGIFGEEIQAEIRQLIRHQFLLDVKTVIPVSFDPDTDEAVLADAALGDADPVILLQEVWQPPIRGLLHYLVRLKQGVLAEKNIWVLLTRTPGEESLSVDAGDTDFKVWQQAVGRLDQPDILVERIRP